MGAAAKLEAKVWNLDDANTVTVLLTKKGHGAACERVVERQGVGGNIQILLDLLVHPAFDLLQLSARQRRKMRKIEPQSIGRDERAGLLDVRAEGFSKRRVEHVGDGVVRCRAFARRGVDTRDDSLVLSEGPFAHADVMAHELAHRRLCVHHVGNTVRAGEHPAVTELAAAFGIEGRLVEEHFTFFPFAKLRHFHSVFHDSEDARFRDLHLRVAVEARLEAPA